MPKGYKPQKAEYWEDVAVIYDLTVREQEQAPTDTGLIDHLGLSIFSFPEERRIGFIHL